VRNVMSDLEELGFITSPHTSAGRSPRRGYRFFVDSLLTVQPIGVGQLEAIQGQIQPGEPQRVINAASQLLSGLTHFAGVVVSPKQDALKIRQIEFVSLSDTRILLILVTTAGDVQNRILFTKRGYSPSGSSARPATSTSTLPGWPSPRSAPHPGRTQAAPLRHDRADERRGRSR
jgi:heat-inducible transcriptional repressor